MERRRLSLILVLAAAASLGLLGPWVDVESARADQATVKIDDSSVDAVYANVCRVVAARDEVIFDFGLTSPDSGKSTEPGPRILMNYFTAKRTLNALSLTLLRHETTFGELKLAEDAPGDPPAGSGRGLPFYANFCRITGTPEELILDYGLNPQPFGVPTLPIPVKSRIIVNFHTAKRLEQSLREKLVRHEKKYGVIETDVQKRVKVSP